MKPSPGRSRKQAASLQSIFLIGSLVLLVFVAVSFIPWMIVTERGKRAVELKKEELIEAGYRLTLLEIGRLYHDLSLDPAENAEPHYREAITLLKAGDAKKERQEGYTRIREAFLELKPEEELPDEIARELAGMMEQNAAVLEALTAAAARPYVRFDLNFTEGYALMIPHVGAMREAARLLSLQAIHHHAEGRPDAAIKSFETALAIAAHLGDEPTLISQLTRVAIAGIVLEAMEWFFDRETASATALERLDAAFGRLETSPGMAQALEAEMAFGNSVFSEPLVDMDILELDNFGHEELQVIFHVLSGRVHRDHLFYLRTMESWLTMMREPLENRLSFDDDLWEREAEEKRYLLSAIIIPSIGRVLQTEAISATRLRIARILIALERHRLEEGNLPENLDALAPHYLDPLPLDPYSGESFRMKREGEWLAIESIGEAAYRPDKVMRPIQGRLPAAR